MPEARYVLDTNVMVSALLFPRSYPLAALDRAEPTGRLLASVETLSEFRKVILRDRFDRYAARDKRLRFFESLTREAELVPIVSRVTACRDPRDDKFLEVAVNGAAAFIVTGDDDLLVLNPFQGISILTPRQFVET